MANFVKVENGVEKLVSQPKVFLTEKELEKRKTFQIPSGKPNF